MELGWIAFQPTAAPMRCMHPARSPPTWAIGLRLMPGNQGEGLWISNRFNGEIHVELRPVKVIRCRPLDIRQLVDRCLPEPRKLRERDEQFLGIEQQPEAVTGHIRDFST